MLGFRGVVLGVWDFQGEGFRGVGFWGFWVQMSGFKGVGFRVLQCRILWFGV